MKYQAAFCGEVALNHHRFRSHLHILCRSAVEILRRVQEADFRVDLGAMLLVAAAVAILALSADDAVAQTTYRLHKNNSTTSGLWQLKTTAPDEASGSVQSVDLKNKATGEYIVKAFDTQAGVPGTAGTISSGSSVTFTLWMKKTANVGTLFPRAKLLLNSASGTSIVTVTGTAALTTTLVKYTLTGTVPNAVNLATSDRFYLWVGVNLTSGSTSTTFKAELDVEGTANGNYDSKIAIPSIVPPPSIAGVSPSTAPPGASVVVTGASFGASQGSSTLTFSGVASTPASWSDASITVPVPAGATTGPVVVTARGFASNGFAFTVVTTGSIAGTITRQSNGTAIAGALAEALLSGNVVGSATTATDGTFGIGQLSPGVYSLRITASGFVTATLTNLNVVAGGTASGSAALATPGSIAGSVTNSSGGVAIAGATVSALSGGQVVASGTTTSSGAYSLPGLPPGTFDVRATRAGFSPQTVTGVTVTSSSTTTANLVMTPTASGSIRYVFDELDRLAAVIDANGDAAIYQYDATGNLLSIARGSATTVSIIEFTPDSGAVGGTVTISGTGFSATPSQNAVSFNGMAATVQSATPNVLVVSIPAGATTGPIAVTSPLGNASSATVFVVGVGGPTAAPTITGFSPSMGDVGATVTITGSNFETDTALDAVFFGGVRAELVTATPTTLTVHAPANGTGLVSVATPHGTADSSSEFFVAPPGYPASTIGSAQRIQFGQVAMVSFNTANKPLLVAFDATAGGQVTLSMFNATLPSWGVVVIDPNGHQIATFNVASPPFTTDLFPHLTGTFIVMVSGGTNMGVMSIVVNPSDALQSGQPVVGGPAVQATTSIPGQKARFTLAGVAGQRLVASVTSSTPANVSIVRPNGAVLALSDFFAGGVERRFDLNPVPESGDYQIVILPGGSATTTATLQLLSSPGLVVGGTPITEVMFAGQPTVLSFPGVANQPVSLVASEVSITTGTLTIRKPDATDLTTVTITPAGDFAFAYLPVSGTYTAVLAPGVSTPGTTTLRLLDASTVQGSLVVGGAPSTMNIAVPGQIGAFTFTGTAGQRVTLKKTSVTMPSGSYLRLYTPAGGLLLTNYVGSAGLFDIPLLPTTGTYKIEITPDPFGATGSVTLALIADVAGSVTIGGSSLPVSITVAEQRAWVTFAGTSGQQVTVRATGNTIASVTVKLLRPDGTQLTASTSSAATFSLATQTLSAAGSYTIVVDPPGSNTGNITISVTSP